MIIPFADVTDEMVDASIENSKDKLRHTVEGEDRVLLKYSPPMSNVFSGIDKYNYSDIMEILSTTEWVTITEEP